MQTAYQALLQKALLKDIFISFDPNYRHLLFKNDTQAFIDQSWNFLDYCHFFKLSEEEAMLITETSTLNNAVVILQKKTRGVFAITLGKEGTMLGFNNTTIVIPSIAIQPVDTTGAGDAFAGAVLYQLSDKTLTQIKAMSESQWKEIVANANKAGARTCEYMGAMEAFKHLNNGIFK